MPCEIWEGLRTHFATLTLISQPCEFQKSLKLLFKGTKALYSFHKPIFTLRNPPPPCDAQATISFLSSGRPTANHLKRWPTPLAPFQPRRALEEAIPTPQYLACRGQEPPILRIHLRPPRPKWPFHLLREECPLAFLNADTRHGDHRLLHPLSHQYAAFHLREPGPQALESHLGMLNLILRPLPILSILPALPYKPSSRGLWSPCRPLRAIQIVEFDYFILSFTSILRTCDSSRSFRIHSVITTQKVLFYTFNALCFKHFCVVVLHL